MTAVASTSALQAAASQEQELSLRQQLVLTQAVVKLGSSDWPRIAALVASVPTAGGPLTAGVCEDVFTALVRANELDLARTAVAQSRPARKLAHKLYGLRLAEIAASLAARSTEASLVQREILEITAGEWDSRVLATVPPELRHEVIITPTPRPIAPAALLPDADPPSGARASRRKGKAASVERVPDSASEREESVGVKDEDDDSARKGSARKSRPRGRRGGRDDDGEDDDPTSETHDEVDTDREMSVPVAGKKSARARKIAPAVPAASRKDRKSSKRKESEAPEPSTPPREGSTRDRKRVKTEDPPDSAVGPSKTERDERAHFRRAITQLLDSLFRFERAWPFTAAVLRRDAPTYDKAIRRPLCLVDIIRGVKTGELLTSTQVTRDVALMFANAVQFNGLNDDIAQCARDSWIEFERLMHMHVSQEYGGV